MKVHALYDPRTSTLTYVAYDPATSDAIVIDPVLDFDPQTVGVSGGSTDQLLAFVREHGLNVHYILETHVHADHLSGAQPLKDALGARTGIGEHVATVQKTFGEIFGWGDRVASDGSQWDLLLRDEQPITAGSLTLLPIHTPGHTPTCTTFRIEDALFTGDTLFMPDFGTGRCDFPGGSASDLYDSVMRLYALPDATRVFVGHDYQPGGRPLAYETTIGESKAKNKQLTGDTERDAFVDWRTARDATLAPPGLIFQSLQVNARGGHLPDPHPNGRRYFLMPMDVF